jgi:hypothetical protein
MGLLTHNLIYLVNEWVYKSPVFGLLARVLGFYPVASGIENSTDHLREKVRQGYALVVFPEGKRSLTNRVGRFHKGAFFLQEQLQIDLLPVYLHGNAEVMPKNDFIIYDGALTVIVGERIPYDDYTFGRTYKERTRNIGNFYKKNFQSHRDRLEHEDYFKQVLLSNYRYKAPWLIREVSDRFKRNKHLYHQLQGLIPEKVKLLHLGNDFGEIDILMVSKHLGRRITSYIEDRERRCIAENCYTSKMKRVKYCHSLEEVREDDFQILLLSQQINANLSRHFLRSWPAQIIVVNDILSRKEAEELGFITDRELDQITCYKRCEK